MSLAKLANTCAHLQNCSRVRLSLTSIPYTRLQLQFAYNLYKHGFLSSLQRGSTKCPDIEPTETTPDNISTRRLWLGLKYRENKPVLTSCKLISKPSLRISLNVSEMKQLCSGFPIRKIDPPQAGELVLINSPTVGLIDINEAIAKGLPGEIVCRIN
ncbi:hypothetical protein TBLA_0B09430 [Henningerozyma blattae CBS 6284]|uniref:Ribosomal protein S8 n=1 Tax=Henningerozyma blattae (strain ATCC 34711 / CBS 6284 / DSM 70876 / NBRC 10599 / NRRL Y-10934 / UCD 77-7) TaxID=1071380 RepID=I2H058_HENB6|nr:hypothetical protein TBLA_0B09430 [Tetrapisispora blattae CBS 6284]CCH59760.1 hypothetical protein TBLA_0B09430 [Tetrapisispora blattae CBS 6284]